MTRRRTASTRRSRPAKRLRRLLRALTRKARRAVRRRIRKAWRRSLRRYAAMRRRQLARRAAVQRERQAAASELSARSLTGKPRPAKAAAQSAAPVGGTATTKRTKDGKFNGSKSTGKRTAAKKTAAKKTAVPAAQRDLARGDATLRRVEGRLERTQKRIDKL